MHRLSRFALAFRHLPSAALLGIPLIVFTTLLVYWPGLNGGFLLDDYQNLGQLEDIERGTLHWWDAVFSTHSGPLGRPVTMLTFVGNILSSGAVIWPLKYTNLMIHVLCGLLILWLSIRLLTFLKPGHSQHRVLLLALTIAALWLLSPLLVSATLYTVQRMAQLAALFSLCGLLAYAMGRPQLETRPVLAWSLVLSSVLVWLPLAVLSKENGALIPLLLLALEIFVYRFAGSAETRRALYLFYALLVLLPTIAVAAILVIRPEYFLASYDARPFTLLERLLTQPRVLLHYVRNLLLPQGSGMGLFYDDYVISTTLFNPVTTLLAVAVWAALLVAAVKLRRHVLHPLFFGPFFFLAGHALESTIFPLEMVFEHRNYLPAFGLFFSLVLSLDTLGDKLNTRTAITTLLALLPIVFGFATYQRAQIWSSWETILFSAQAAHGNSPRLHAELASHYAEVGKLSDALSHLNEVTRLRKSAESAVALHRIIVYCQTGERIPDSVYERFPARMATDDAGIYAINSLRGVVKVVHTDQCTALNIPRLVENLDRWAINAPPNNYEGRLWDVYYESAQLLHYIGQWQQAVERLRRADDIWPTRPEALLTMMHYQYAQSDYVAAIHTLQQLRTRFATSLARDKRVISKYAAIIAYLDQLAEEHKFGTTD